MGFKIIICVYLWRDNYFVRLCIIMGMLNILFIDIINMYRNVLNGF